MNDDPNPRDAAISAFRQREAEAGRVSSKQAHAEQEQSRRHEASLTAWSTQAFNAISLGVMQVGNDFAQRGSPFIIRQRPESRPGIAGFEVHRSGSLDREATLTFILHPDGLVRAETDIRGAKLPDGITADAVTSQWAEQAAEQIMFAVLGGQRMPIPDDDFIKGGFQTSVPNQPRNSRLRRPNG